MGVHAGTKPIVTDSIDQIYDFAESSTVCGATVTSLITSSDEMTLVNSPTVSGGTCTLDGTNDAISLDSTSNLWSANDTAECWELAFKIKSGTGECHIMHQSNVWYYKKFFMRNSSNKFWLQATGTGNTTQNSSDTSDDDLLNNVWYVLACNFYRSSVGAKPQMIAYLNGTQVAGFSNIGGTSSGGPWGIGTGSTPVIGADDAAGSSPTNVEIAFFRKYGKNLSATEILSNYNAMMGRLV